MPSEMLTRHYRPHDGEMLTPFWRVVRRTTSVKPASRGNEINPGAGVPPAVTHEQPLLEDAPGPPPVPVIRVRRRCRSRRPYSMRRPRCPASPRLLRHHRCPRRRRLSQRPPRPRCCRAPLSRAATARPSRLRSAWHRPSRVIRSPGSRRCRAAAGRAVFERTQVRRLTDVSEPHVRPLVDEGAVRRQTQERQHRQAAVGAAARWPFRRSTSCRSARSTASRRADAAGHEAGGAKATLWKSASLTVTLRLVSHELNMSLIGPPLVMSAERVPVVASKRGCSAACRRTSRSCRSGRACRRRTPLLNDVLL